MKTANLPKETDRYVDSCNDNAPSLYSSKNAMKKISLTDFIISIQNCTYKKDTKTNTKQSQMINLENILVLTFYKVDEFLVQSIRKKIREETAYIADYQPSSDELTAFISVEGAGDKKRHSSATRAGFAWCDELLINSYLDPNSMRIGTPCKSSNDPTAFYTGRIPKALKPIELELGDQSEKSQDSNKLDAMFLPSNNTSITDSAKTIFPVIAKKEDMFIFGGAIVEEIKGKGQTSLKQVSPEAFRSRIESYDKPVMSYVTSNNEYALKPKICSIGNAKALMETKEARDLLPQINMVTECQILTNNLNVLDKGFHFKEGILVSQGKNVVKVDPEEAVEKLQGLLADNDFVTESDRSRALSMMILPMMKMGGFITAPCPMDIAEANESQSGKTYRQKVIAAIYNSSPLIVTQKNGGVGSVDESIASALATGRSFTLLDNFRGNFNSPMLEAIITTPETVPVRLPRQAEQTINATTVSFQLSSNGVDTTADLANRACIIRMRKQPDKQWKTWTEGDLLSHVRINQHYYLGCIFSVIKSWVNSGRPKTNTTEHDMREWAQTMDWIVQNIFKMPHLLEDHKNLQKQVSNPQLNWLREVCIKAEQNNKLGIELLAHDIADLCDHADIKFPNNRTYDSEGANKYIGVIMGKLLNNENSIIVDNYKIIREEKSKYHDKQKRHKPTKTYVINLR